MREWNLLVVKPNWGEWLSASRLPEKPRAATAQPRVAVPLLNPAVVPISTASRERQGCQPGQKSSMFYCTPAVNGAREAKRDASFAMLRCVVLDAASPPKCRRGPSLTLFARDEHPGRMLVYRTST